MVKNFTSATHGILVIKDKNGQIREKGLVSKAIGFPLKSGINIAQKRDGSMKDPVLEEKWLSQENYNKERQKVLKQLIPIPPNTKIAPNMDYGIVLNKWNGPIRYIWMASSLRAGFPELLSFFSETETYEIHLHQGVKDNLGTILFSMFMEAGKVAVVTYDFNDIPFEYASRVKIAGDPKTPQKKKITFGGQQEYVLYRRNFIGLKEAQNIATHYLKEGKLCQTVTWDEFLW